MSRSIRAAERAALDFGAEVFVDLEPEVRIWGFGRKLDSFPTLVHVMHSREQLVGDFGRRHALRPLLHRVRTALFRRLFERATAVVCFTPVTTATVREFAGGTPVVRAGYPLVGAAALNRGSSADDGPRNGPARVLVAGHVRPDRGVDELLRALEAVATPTVVEILGLQAAPLRLPARVGPHRIAIDDRLVSEADMAAAHRSADVVVAPFPESYARAGRYRGSLGKAVAYGAPVLTTARALEQIPDGYPAVVVPSWEPGPIAVGLSEVLRRGDELRLRARQQGPAFAQGHLTFEAFAQVLESVVAAGGE